MNKAWLILYINKHNISIINSISYFKNDTIKAKEKLNTINNPLTHNQHILYSGKVLAVKCNRTDLLANSTTIIK